MTVNDYNTFCAGLPHTTHVVQWGGAHVWKVAGKVFAVAGWSKHREQPAVTFKVSPAIYEMLSQLPGLRPAPYLASRGMTWIQWTGPETMDEATLRDYLAASHRLVAEGLPKRRRIELGLMPAPVPTRSNKETHTARKSRGAAP
jgi:predicted DNA-binding protein (MmcQ/YjbR family)